MKLIKSNIFDKPFLKSIKKLYIMDKGLNKYLRRAISEKGEKEFIQLKENMSKVDDDED